MSFANPARTARSRRPAVEGYEPRLLLSGATAAMIQGGHIGTNAMIVGDHAGTNVTMIQGGHIGTNVVDDVVERKH